MHYIIKSYSTKNPFGLLKGWVGKTGDKVILKPWEGESQNSWVTPLNALTEVEAILAGWCFESKSYRTIRVDLKSHYWIIKVPTEIATYNDGRTIYFTDGTKTIRATKFENFHGFTQLFEWALVGTTSGKPLGWAVPTTTQLCKKSCEETATLWSLASLPKLVASKRNIISPKLYGVKAQDNPPYLNSCLTAPEAQGTTPALLIKGDCLGAPNMHGLGNKYFPISFEDEELVVDRSLLSGKTLQNY